MAAKKTKPAETIINWQENVQKDLDLESLNPAQALALLNLLSETAALPGTRGYLRFKGLSESELDSLASRPGIIKPPLPRPKP